MAVKVVCGVRDLACTAMKRNRHENMRASFTVFAAAAVLLSAASAGAQTGTLSVELNAAQKSEKGCRLTFVVNNGLGSDLAKAGFEFVLFDKAGVVDRITALEFKELSAAKTKVSRFDLSGVNCDNLGRVLINAVTECEGTGIDATICAKQLKTSSKAGIEFGV